MLEYPCKFHMQFNMIEDVKDVTTFEAVRLLKEAWNSELDLILQSRWRKNSICPLIPRLQVVILGADQKNAVCLAKQL